MLHSVSLLRPSFVRILFGTCACRYRMLHVLVCLSQALTLLISESSSSFVIFLLVLGYPSRLDRRCCIVLTSILVHLSQVALTIVVCASSFDFDLTLLLVLVFPSTLDRRCCLVLALHISHVALTIVVCASSFDFDLTLLLVLVFPSTLDRRCCTVRCLRSLGGSMLQ